MSVVHKGMGKILEGIVKYQKTISGELIPLFREILDRPSPKTIIVSCIDSRVVASRLLQSQPGAYFLVRTPGNFIPKFESLETSIASATPAAFELACVNNKANTIVVIGNSDSKPMNILYDMKDDLEKYANDSSALKRWLVSNGRDTVHKYKEFEQTGFKKALKFSHNNAAEFEAYIDPENKFGPRDRFSQINVLKQLKNVNNYNFLKDNISKNLLRGYALWVDYSTNDLYMFSFKEKRFIKIDESTYEKLYSECNTKFE